MTGTRIHTLDFSENIKQAYLWEQYMVHLKPTQWLVQWEQTGDTLQISASMSSLTVGLEYNEVKKLTPTLSMTEEIVHEHSLIHAYTDG